VSADGNRRTIDSLRLWAVPACAAVLVGALGAYAALAQSGGSRSAAGGLASVESFSSIQATAARSAALFAEAAKVIQHPRCINCHPATRSPTQGDDMHPHIPPIASDAAMRASGIPCASCHQAKNSPTASAGIRSVPGAEHWGLAPQSMAWQGLTIGGICEQLKDPARNGNRSLEQIRVHMSEDHLVGWAWHPGEGRTPAPGTHAEFGRLIAGWVATGAHCPK
jgi:hypothetical protein